MMPKVKGSQKESPSSEISGGGGAQAGMRQRRWTEEEEAILTEYVTKHGEGKWGVVERNSGLNRSAESCRRRWACIVDQLPLDKNWYARVTNQQRLWLPLYPDDINPASPAAIPIPPPTPSLLSPILPESSDASFLFPAHLTANPIEKLLTQYESRLAMRLVNSELPSNQILMESEAVPPVNRSAFVDGPSNTVLADHIQMADSDPAHFYSGEAQEVGASASLGKYIRSNHVNRSILTVPEGECSATGREISNVHSSNLASDEGYLDLQDPPESDTGRTPTTSDNENGPWY